MVSTGCRRIFLKCRSPRLSRPAACAGCGSPLPAPGTIEIQENLYKEANAALSYQVADSAGSVLYGNKEGSYFPSEYERNGGLNKTKSLEKNSYLHLVPILDTDGKIAGTAALLYELKMSFADARGRMIARY